MASFKVPCPSCEHQVPIKSESAIGTKVECPKCKYRFKVEAPAGGVPKDTGKPEKKKTAAAGGQKKSKKTVAIIVGVLAVGILAAVGFAFMGGDKKPPISKGGGGGGGGGGGVVNPGDGPGEPKKEDENPKKPVDKPKSSIPYSQQEASNLLPGETRSLCRIDVEKVHRGPAGVLFDPAMLDMFEKSFGIKADQVAVYYHAYVGDARDPFGVMRLDEPVLEKAVVAKMAPSAAPRAIKKRNLYKFRSNPFVNGASNALAFGSLFGELYERLPASPNEKTPPDPAKPQPPRAIGLCVYDSQHILVGDYAQLEKFLGTLSDKGDPKFQSDTTEAPGVTLTDTRLFLSIDPKLKRAMRELGAESQTPPQVVFAEKYTTGAYDLTGLKEELLPVAAVLNLVLNQTDYIGANLVSFDEKQLIATVRLVMKSDGAAFDAVKSPLTPALATASQFLSLYLNTPVEFRNPDARGGVPAPGMGGMIPPMPMVGDPGRPPPGMGGSSLGPPPMVGGTGVPPGMGMGRPGEIGPLGPPTGMGDPGTGNPGTPEPSQLPPSRIDLGLTDQNITIKIELNWSSDTFRHKLEPRIIGVANTLKGKMGVYTSDASFHALSAAVRRMTEATKAFPRGTAERPLRDISRLGLKYEPKTRVSFFAELLPYLGSRGESLRAQIDPDRAWFDDGRTQNPPGKNTLGVAEEWVPELLVSTYPQSAWRATSTLVPPGRVLGGTNYVGIAGIGLDAARYDPTDDANKKRMGITGYDWGSKLEEVTDGLENTIYLMQTPPGLQQPWLSGGGATIRGLDEKDPMKGFRHTIGTPGGKEGTFALMGDGSVRFIPGDIEPKLLLAMATRAGGEDIASRLDKEAPLVTPVKKKEVELKTDPTPDPKPEVGPPAPEKK
jgi:hypothetical protein